MLGQVLTLNQVLRPNENHPPPLTALLLNIESLEIPEILIITPDRHGDERGFFSETYTDRIWQAAGLAHLQFVQDNHASSAQAGTIRGLHYQIPPHAQAKLVRVSRGAVLDVVLDIRRRSPTFGRHVTSVISAEAWNQIFIPQGFAHGYATLEPDTEVLYKTSDFYAPDSERSICWNDPALGIDWKFLEDVAVVSEKDRANPRLIDAVDLFD